MRRFLLLLVGLLLSGVGQDALSAQYSWTSTALGLTWSTNSTDCFVVSRAFTELMTGYSRAMNGSSDYFFYTGNCSGEVVNVGDSFTSVVWHFGLGVADTQVWVFPLVAIVEDVADVDVAAFPLQRVLVMVGCALMFGIGMVVGKA